MTPSGTETRARSVAKLTVASAPSTRLSFFSIRAAHEEHVIPVMSRSMMSAMTESYPLGVSIVKASAVAWSAPPPGEAPAANAWTGRTGTPNRGPNRSPGPGRR